MAKLERSDWDYFDAMDAILGNRPATKPPVVIDTSSAPVTTDEHVEQQDDSEPELDKDSETLSTGSAASSVPSTSTNSTVVSVCGSTPLTSRKRKRSAKPDNAIVDMIDSIMKAQQKK